MTYQPEYLQNDDIVAIRELALTAHRYGAVYVSVYDSEGFVEKVACTPSVLLEAIDGLDIDVSLKFRDEEGKKLGWVDLVLGNGDNTTIADYGINEWTDKVLAF